MIHILKIIAIITAITYSLQLVNSQSDLLVFGGLAVVGASLYFFIIELKEIFTFLKSKL
ncbi:hypothetical protein [Dyadobacter sp. LHD-138]|uniref:hypothetical protein n=1 Tax=Dyadobacter sp. LHD-138 TaxID=3071413 RepID=UPI0027E05BA3|nr:hypothetical protein [Dyadobacter sp. LHD-138]MDQ6477544.1 hypothetical protein [Dyadobacter sp. LHD-138]